jgi:chromosome segregation ATPase
MRKSQSLLLTVVCMVGLSGPANLWAEDQTKSSPSSDSAQENRPKTKSKKVYTNEDLIRLKETTPINQAPEATQDSKKTGKAEAAADIGRYRDSQGHDRNYWQQKIRPLRKQLESLDSQIASLQAKQGKLNAASGVKVSRSGKLQSSSSDTRAQLTKRIDGLNAKKSETLKSIQEVEEDARKAQALPEWLR